MSKNVIEVSNLQKEFTKIIKEEVSNIIQEADRHRPGYYKEYNKRCKKEGKTTDRHLVIKMVMFQTVL